VSGDRSFKVLVVDDEESTATTLKKFIEGRFDASGCVALSLNEARRLIHAESFDLITLDYQFPDGTGLELLQEISPSGATPLVIMVTGQGAEQIASEAFILGASGYVVKDDRMRLMLEAAIDKAITERTLEATRKNLQETEDRYQAVFDAANDAIFVHDEETGGILDVNRKMCEMFGYSKEEARALQIEDISAVDPPFSQREAMKWIAKASREGPQLFEWHCRDSSGRLFWAEVNLKKAKLGGIDRMLSLVRDISERKEAADMLAASERKFRILGSVSREIFAVDLDYEQTIDTMCNCACRVLGDLCVIRVLSEDNQSLDVVGTCHKDPEALKLASELFEKERLEETDGLLSWIESVGRSLYLPEISARQLEAMTDRVFWPYVERYGVSSLVMVPLRFKGRVYGTISVSRDGDSPTLTRDDRTLMEEIADRATMAIDRARLLTRLEVELASRKERETELEGFAHAVSHDLKGPISTTKAGLEIVRDALGSPDLSFWQRDLEELIGNLANTMATSYTLVDDLLKLAESGRVPSMVHWVDVGQVIEQAIEMLTSVIREKGTEIRVDPDMGSIMANQTHILQVFSNIIANAVRHNDTARPIVEIRNLGSTDGTHRYLVRDNGSGLPEGYIGNVFMPFFRAKGGGKVIGLAIVDRILRTYGGGIKAYNDGGANFELVFKDFPADESIGTQ
jgi:PAS domain S-box-containing protein